MTTPTPPSEFMQMVRDATELASRWEPKHPQYIEGRFYLTPAQWEAVKDASAPAEDADGRWNETNRASAIWGIPVEVMPLNEPIRLPSGKVLVYSALLEAFYVFDPAIARDAGLMDVSNTIL